MDVAETWTLSLLKKYFNFMLQKDLDISAFVKKIDLQGWRKHLTNLSFTMSCSGYNISFSLV